MDLTPFRCKIAGNDAIVTTVEGITPDPKLPVLLYAHVKLIEPDESGFAGEDEAEDVEDLRQVLVKVLEIRLQAVFVGSIATAGRFEIYLYAPDADGLNDASGEALLDFDEYTVDMGSQPDPDWKHFREVLTPGPTV